MDIKLVLGDVADMEEPKESIFDLIHQAIAEATRNGIKANSIVINKNMVRVPEQFGEWPEMICGLHCYFTADMLPDGYAFSVQHDCSEGENAPKGNKIPYEKRVEIYTHALFAYGQQAQMVVALEELSECQKEICKVMRGNMDHLAEEIADATIMLEQLRYFLGLNDQVCQKMDEKIRRLDDLKQKLAELIEKAEDATEGILLSLEHTYRDYRMAEAEFLIANGVTVKDSEPRILITTPPNVSEDMLKSKTIRKHVTACTYMGGYLGAEQFSRHVRNVTHWMPLPEPPEEVE